MKNTKKILSLFLTLFLITACSKQGVSQEKIFVFESDPSKSKSFAHIYDRELNEVKKVDLNTYLIGQKFQNLSQYNNNLVLACNLSSERDKSPSNSFLILNNKALEFNKVNLKYGSLDTIAVDDNFVYGSSQNRGNLVIEKASLDNKKQENNIKLEIKDRFSDYIGQTDKYIYLHLNYSPPGEKSELAILDKENLKELKRIPLNKKDVSKVKSSKLIDNRIVLVGGNGYHEGAISSIDLNADIVKSSKITGQCMGIAEMNNKYYIISCDDETNPNSKSTIWQLNKDSLEAKKVKELNHRILNVATLDKGLAFLALNEIWVYDNNFKLENHKKLDNDFNLEMATIN